MPACGDGLCTALSRSVFGLSGAQAILRTTASQLQDTKEIYTQTCVCAVDSTTVGFSGHPQKRVSFTCKVYILKLTVTKIGPISSCFSGRCGWVFFCKWRSPVLSPGNFCCGLGAGSFLDSPNHVRIGMLLGSIVNKRIGYIIEITTLEILL